MRRFVTIVAIGVSACASRHAAPPGAAVVRVEKAAPSPPAGPVGREALEREWRELRPVPLKGTERGTLDGGRPLYPIVRMRALQASVGYFGHAGHPTFQRRSGPDKTFFVLAGRDILRFPESGFDVEWARGAPYGGELPSSVWTESRGDTKEPHLFIETMRRWPVERDDYAQGAPADVNPFEEHVESLLHLHAGKWSRFPTSDRRAAYGSGWMSLQIPPAPNMKEIKARCADFACGKLAPKVVPIGLGDALVPDFAALFAAKDIAWVHLYERERDYELAVDAAGAVYVFVRASSSGKRVFGVLRWTPGEGARFDVLAGAAAGPLADGDAHVEVRGASKPEKGQKVTFNVEVRRSEKVTATSLVSFDGKTWSVKKPPPPRVVPETYEPYDPFAQFYEVEGYKVIQNYAPVLLAHTGGDHEKFGEWQEVADGSYELVARAKNDLFYMSNDAIYRSVLPAETLTLTDMWAPLHPWPLPADDDCDHPFVVLDVMTPDLYETALATRNRGDEVVWGAFSAALVAEWPQVKTVTFRLFDERLVVIGAALTSMKEAKAFSEKAPDWTSARFGRARGGAGVYCARPIAPVAFVPTTKGGG